MVPGTLPVNVSYLMNISLTEPAWAIVENPFRNMIFELRYGCTFPDILWYHFPNFAT